MRVYPIGVGTAFGRRFFNTNFVIEFGNGDFLLVDCGITASRSLEMIGMSVLDVKNLFVSHLHADHIGGVEELALKNKLIMGRKTNLYINGQLVDSFWASVRSGIEHTQLGKLGIDDYFNVYTHSDGFVLDGVEFSSQPTHHIDGMLSFDIGFGNLLLTSDTVFSCDYVTNRARDFEIVVHDCSFNGVQKVHTFYEDLIENRALFDHLYVIHYEDEVDRFRKRILSADIEICRQYVDIVNECVDGDSIMLRPDDVTIRSGKPEF
jgi:glyoxylase-like metal-dependent hydrolase (beta-lactamase superfamily II)